MDKPPPMLGTRRWFGELLTWFVPTAGSAPAEGFIRRGIAWLLFLNLASIVVASLFICSWIPTWICFVTTLLFWGAGLAMLIDHFRKGSRTFPLFIAFLILLILTDILPPAGHIVARPFKIPTGAMQPTFNGVSGYPSTGPTPNFLHRCADLLLRGRHYIDVV
ncbi:MAG: hypothetical protein ACJ8M1_15625, partial [Chthoniobacterales bacterium]